MTSRRNFLTGAGAITGRRGRGQGGPGGHGRPAEAVTQTKPTRMPPLAPPKGREYRPVVHLNGWTRPGA